MPICYIILKHYCITEKLLYELCVIQYEMVPIEKILVENAKEYFKNASRAAEESEFNTAATLLFKTMSALADLFLFKKEGRIPSSHTDRFRTLESKYPDVYKLLDRNFSFYQDSYRSRLDKETVDAMMEDVKELSQLVGIGL